MKNTNLSLKSWFISYFLFCLHLFDKIVDLLPFLAFLLIYWFFTYKFFSLVKSSIVHFLSILLFKDLFVINENLRTFVSFAHRSNHQKIAQSSGRAINPKKIKPCTEESRIRTSNFPYPIIKSNLIVQQSLWSSNKHSSCAQIAWTDEQCCHWRRKYGKGITKYFGRKLWLHQRVKQFCICGQFWWLSQWSPPHWKVENNSEQKRVY